MRRAALTSRRRSTMAAVAVALGVFLLALAAYGLIVDDARDAGSSDLSVVEPFDLRPHAMQRDQRPPPGPPPGRTTTVPAPAAPATVPPTTAPRPVPLPVTLRIPEVGVDTPLLPLGLNPDNTLEVPKDFALAGWYIYRSVPGEPGPSVIAGHVDSKKGPAVFYRLRDLGPGATIEVARSDGSTAKFTVVAKEQHDKDAFPTARVYGPTDSPELRLITCGGTFDRSSGHYNDNIIVFAELSEIV